jgi:ABC-type branched-subunit amino acid transport system ATPase component
MPIASASSSAVDPEFVLQDVNRYFGGFRALSDVSLRLRGPGVIGLVGQNGAGKSTMLSLLCGALAPSTGQLIFDGEPVTRRRQNALPALGVCRLFQEVHLIAGLRTWENIALGLGVRPEPGRRRALLAGGGRVIARVRACAHEVGLGDDVLDSWPAALPIGTQRRVELARLTASRPRVALLDEPTANLSPAESDEVADVVRHLAETALVILVEHNMQLVYTVGERVIVLAEGNVVADGPPAQVARDPAVRRAYLGYAGDIEERQ